MEQAVTNTTGASLSSQLLDLAARKLVLTVYLSADNRPEGVLIARVPAKSSSGFSARGRSWNRE